jgi:hypothetical protein
MNSEIEIENILERMGNEWPVDDSLVNRVLGRIESEAVCVEPRHAKLWVNKSFLAIAASLVVMAGLWWIVAGGNTLYAQVVNAIQRTRTLHMTTMVRADREKAAQQVGETWYERGVGFRETIGSDVHLGNQKSFWSYVQGSKVAIRSDSHGVDDIVNRMLDNEIVQALKDAQTERDTKGDETVDGQTCRAYVLTNFASATDPALKSGKKRLRILLDDQSRIVRAFIEERSDDRWLTQVTMNWKYDVPVDRTLFEPRFGDDVTIVEADTVFDTFVDLQRAVHREERSGIEFAIHHVERFQNGGILVVSSVRGTADTLKKYPLTRRRVRMGQFFVDGPAVNYEGSPQGSDYFRIDLATVDHEGINVRWWALVPRNTPPNHFEITPDKVKLTVGISPRGEFAQTHFTDGLSQQWDVILDVPRTDHLPTLDAIATQVFADLNTLDAIPFKWLDIGPKDHEEQIIDPSKTTAAAFSEAFAAHIRSWYERDIEFQLEGQFTIRKDPRNEVPNQAADNPAMGFMYNPLVDDATLARVATHTSLKRLYLEGTKITDAGLRHLSGLKELHSLSLANTSIGDIGLKELERLSALRTLNLQNTHVTPEGAARLKAVIPALKIKQ